MLLDYMFHTLDLSPTKKRVFPVDPEFGCVYCISSASISNCAAAGGSAQRSVAGHLPQVLKCRHLYRIQSIALNKEFYRVVCGDQEPSVPHILMHLLHPSCG